ncbi:MAG: hypothetical protein B7Y43_19440 [Sphingomonas sp. 28-62-20]|jgi:ketosteroid isomerase-like protein|uniref:nuclear transport factor 2 family protein n=1 Tax=unclassified Sphingomonas TaxID=196159 RepID=UPI000BCA6119|nr:nuclear transport factor 2 family protein [Sphingomonas sp. TF3]OYY74777.1 MAG: hypothetical protein B7Y43_19440 [Sphingomonas sp. 28-62-20]RUN75482.1 hypothetical protein EJC47_15730 [Sphingomonas sp. TF3]
MTSTKAVVGEFMRRLEAIDFAGAFGMLAEDGCYTIVGQTPASRTYVGAREVLETLVPALATFAHPPKLTFSTPIIEGDRAVLLAAGRGVGPTGIVYDQPHCAFVTRVRDDQLVEIVEFVDTAMLEIAFFGNKIVPADM